MISPSPSVASLAASFTAFAPSSIALPVASIALPVALSTESVIGIESLSTIITDAVVSMSESVFTVSVFLQDVTGFMVGSKSEHGGIIKDGAKMVNAVSNSVVPKFTIIIGNSYGAGNYAMCGKAYDPRLIFAWPSAELAVMSGNSAAKVLLQIEKASLEKKGEKITKEKEDELFNKIKDRYDNQVSPYYAASRIWTDAVIDPLDTRTWISMGIEAANHAPIEKKFNLGVIQV